MSAFAQDPVPEQARDKPPGQPEDAIGDPAPAQAAADACALPLDFSGAVFAAPERVPALEEGEAPASERCAELITAHSFGAAVRLLPDAAAAWRIAIETVRAHHRTAGRPKRREILVVSDDPRLPPALAADAAVQRTAEDESALEAAVGPTTAGILLAPVSIAAGLKFQPGVLLATARALADDYGMALLYDESDAGFGRTGMAFAHEWRGVTPDLMVVEGACGTPASALVLTARFAKSLPAAAPLAEEAAAELLPLVEAAFAPGFEARVQELGWMLEDRLAALRWKHPDLFRDTAGTGLVQGLVCNGKAEALAESLASAGLLARVAGDVLAFLPPLTVTPEEITAAMDMLDAAVAAETAPAA